MHSRSVQFAAGLGIVFAAAVLATLTLSSWRDGQTVTDRAVSAAPTTFRPNTKNTVDDLILTDTADGFRAGEMKRLAPRGDSVALDDRRERSWPKSGQWTSPQVATKFAFTELVPSWNVLTPAETGASFDVRVRDASTGAWSDWLYIGSCGRTLTPVERTIESGAARVKIDELLLNAPADAYQVRATLYSFDFDVKTTPTLRRIAVVYTGETSDPTLRSRLRPPAPPDGAWARDLAIPYRSQGDPIHPPPLRPQICSPTSVSMVMHYCGIDRPTVENALAIYDPEYRLFGNWNRAVQHAGSLGLDAWIARFRTWDQVKHEIARGNPVIASIRFERGVFPSALYSRTNGHLLVIRGFTKDGDVIVNDPNGSAATKEGDGVVYKASELGRAWFDNGGVGYLIRKPPSEVTVSR